MCLFKCMCLALPPSLQLPFIFSYLLLSNSFILYFLFSEAPLALLQKQAGLDLIWKKLSQDNIVLLPGETEARLRGGNGYFGGAETLSQV